MIILHFTDYRGRRWATGGNATTGSTIPISSGDPEVALLVLHYIPDDLRGEPVAAVEGVPGRRAGGRRGFAWADGHGGRGR